MTVDMNGPRYQADDENIEHACCYGATVVDITKLTQYGKYPEIVCECFDIETAQRIATALNRAAE